MIKPVMCVGVDASQKDEQGEKRKDKTPPPGAGENLRDDRPP